MANFIYTKRAKLHLNALISLGAPANGVKILKDWIASEEKRLLNPKPEQEPELAPEPETEPEPELKPKPNSKPGKKKK